MGCAVSRRRTSVTRLKIAEYDHGKTKSRQRERRTSTVTVEVQDRAEAAYKRRTEALRRVSIKVSEDEIERIKRAKLNHDIRQVNHETKPVKRVQIQEPPHREDPPRKVTPPQEKHRLITGPIIVEEEFVNDDKLNPVRDHWNRTPTPDISDQMLQKPDRTKERERCDSGFHDEESNKFVSPFTPDNQDEDSDRQHETNFQRILDDKEDLVDTEYNNSRTCSKNNEYS